MTITTERPITSTVEAPAQRKNGTAVKITALIVGGIVALGGISTLAKVGGSTAAPVAQPAVEAPVEPAPAAPAVEEPLIDSTYDQIASAAWAQFTADEHQGMCQGWVLYPADMKDAFLDGYSPTSAADGEAAWAAMERLLLVECASTI
jgi:hypothetical protein